jgi:hypothetical protein
MHDVPAAVLPGQLPGLRAVSGNLSPMSEIQNVASIFFKKNHMFNNIFHN